MRLKIILLKRNLGNLIFSASSILLTSIPVCFMVQPDNFTNINNPRLLFYSYTYPELSVSHENNPIEIGNRKEINENKQVHDRNPRFRHPYRSPGA